MEPESALFLKKVAKSVFIGFAWLAITSVIAVKGDMHFLKRIFLSEMWCFIHFI